MSFADSRKLSKFIGKSPRRRLDYFDLYSLFFCLLHHKCKCFVFDNNYYHFNKIAKRIPQIYLDGILFYLCN